MPVPTGLAPDLSGVRFIDVPAWSATRDSWAARLGVPPESLTPGAEVGPPCGEVCGPITEDVVHPSPGEVWVQERVAERVAKAAFDGVTVVPVELIHRTRTQTTPLWSLVPHGHAWRIGTRAESLRLCEVCGRTGFPDPDYRSVDESRWEGSDFCDLDGNPNIMIVTERIADELSAARFSNIAFRRA